MLCKPQFSLAYLMLEVFWIALAIALVRSIYLTWNLMMPRPWLFTIPAAAVVIPTAIGGLFGQMRNGALVGVAIIVIWVLHRIWPFFPQVY